jgi:predicted transcriptional regulator
VAELGALEATIMDCVWSSSEPLTVRDILARLDRKPAPAYTTVLSVCQNLERKGFLTHDAVGTAYRYAAVQTREQHTAAVMNAALDGAGGPRESALLAFVEQLSDVETKALADALARARRASRRRAK